MWKPGWGPLKCFWWASEITPMAEVISIKRQNSLQVFTHACWLSITRSPEDPLLAHLWIYSCQVKIPLWLFVWENFSSSFQISKGWTAFVSVPLFFLLHSHMLKLVCFPVTVSTWHNILQPTLSSLTVFCFVWDCSSDINQDSLLPQREVRSHCQETKLDCILANTQAVCVSHKSNPLYVFWCFNKSRFKERNEK